MTLTEAFRTSDMEEIIDSMTAYAYSRFKDFPIKELDGKQPEDFVSEIIDKVIEGRRDWEKAKCSFKEFLFGCLRSHISNFFASHDAQYSNEEFQDIASEEEETGNEELIKITIESLKKHGADEDEINIFGCWMDGINVPREVAQQLNMEIKHVYNITKRLERRLAKIKPQISKLI